MEFKNKVTVALIALSLAGTAEAMPPKGKTKGGGAASTTPTKPKPATAAPAPATPKTPKSPTLKERFAALPADVQATLEPQIKALQASYSVGDAKADLIRKAEADVMRAALPAAPSSASKRSLSAGSERSVSPVGAPTPASVSAPTPAPAEASGETIVDTAAPAPAAATVDAEVSAPAPAPALVREEEVASHHRAPTAATAAALDAANVTKLVPEIEEKIAAQRRASVTAEPAAPTPAPEVVAHAGEPVSDPVSAKGSLMESAPAPAPAPAEASGDATVDTAAPAPAAEEPAEAPAAKPSYAAVAAGTQHADAPAAAPAVAPAVASSETAVDKAAEQLKAWANEFPIHSSDISASAQARRTPEEAFATANKAVRQAQKAGNGLTDVYAMRATAKRRVAAEIKAQRVVNAAVHAENRKEARARFKAMDAPATAAHFKALAEARKAAETATDQEKELYEKYVAAFSGSNGPARILMPGEEPVSASKKAGELPALDEAMAKKLVENATLPSKDKEDEAAQLGALFGSVSESDFVTPDQNTTAQAWYTSFGSKVVNNPGISGVTMGAVFAAGFTGQAAYNFWQLAARSGKKASFGDFVTYFRGELTKKLSAQQVETYLKAGAVLFPAAGGAVALFNHFQK